MYSSSGVVTGGENVNLPATIAEKGLTFKGEYFANAELTGVYLTCTEGYCSGARCRNSKNFLSHIIYLPPFKG